MQQLTLPHSQRQQSQKQKSVFTEGTVSQFKKNSPVELLILNFSLYGILPDSQKLSRQCGLICHHDSILTIILFF